MRLIFIYGPPASGKYTVAKIVAEQTGLALFHNHLIVDAVAAVFPFGSENFVQLREKFWIETIAAAAMENRSLIFTYLPENSVQPDFALRVKTLVENSGGQVLFVQLHLSRNVQLQRIANADRANFGKLRDTDILRANFEQFEACTAAMPAADLVIETERSTPDDSARRIVERLAEV